jgi:hypothetical protein
MRYLTPIETQYIQGGLEKSSIMLACGLSGAMLGGGIGASLASSIPIAHLGSNLGSYILVAVGLGLGNGIGLGLGLVIGTSSIIVSTLQQTYFTPNSKASN